MTREGRWKDMAGALSDTVLDEFLVSGWYDEQPTALISRLDGLVQRITLTVPADPEQDAAVAAMVVATRARFDGYS